MTAINEIIKREVNPFDRINIKPTNFWEEQQDPGLTVNSIHQEAINEIEELLHLVATDHRSRTVLLLGDSGSGKSHLLGRLKRTLNPKAFFAYILCDWADSSYIWRHILRSTVDSLTQVPEGEQDSQLLLWLKSLSAFTKRDVKQRIFNDNFWEVLQSDRQKFIQHLKKTYRTARIYNPDIFFGVLHDLTNPELYDLACEWLRGDDLSEESMQALKVKHCIDEEDVAKNILANFGRISTETQPIVLCFDNLDSMPKLPDGFLDIQPFLDVNTSIHGDCLKNFLIIISAITNTWKRHIDRIQPADKAGIHKFIQLKRINLEQTEALWAYHLNPLHQQANPQPDSKIFPLNREVLDHNFPGGRTIPRYAILLGQQEYQKYKLGLVPPPNPDPNPPINPPPPLPLIDKTKAEFQLLWQEEYKKVQGKITKISLIAAPDLIRMLQEALAALEVQEIKPKLLTGKYANYSLSYQQPGKKERVGIVWTEDSNMRSFYDVMSACHRALDKNACQTLQLIRITGVGTPNLAGNKIYSQIFTATHHHHIKPSLSSVHYLGTYHSLVNSALANELVVAGKTINLKELEALIRESKILDDCRLLQDLGIVLSPGSGTEQKKPDKEKDDWKPVKDFLFNLVITQQYMGRRTLLQNGHRQFPELHESEIEKLINQLYLEKRINIVNPKAKREDQTVCLVV